MKELLIATNPSKRRRKMSAKQRAAALRNLRKARRARSGGKRRRRNPIAANPVRRRKRRRSFFARRIRRRRNPSFSLRRLSPRALLSKVTPALVGGGGAVANDLIYATALGFVPATFAPELVENFRSGMLRHVGRAISAVVLGSLAGYVLPRRVADQMATGALTVVGYNVVREAVEKVRPGTLGMYLDDAQLGYAGAGWNPVYGSDWRAKSGLSAYLTRSGNGNGGQPGRVSVPAQFDTRGQFGRRGGTFVMPTAETGT